MGHSSLTDLAGKQWQSSLISRIYYRNFCKMCEGYSLDRHSIGIHMYFSWNYPSLAVIWPLVSVESINLQLWGAIIWSFADRKLSNLNHFTDKVKVYFSKNITELEKISVSRD